MLALVTKSKPVYGNVLGYDTKTKEYVYLKFSKEQWREPAKDGKLFDYCNQQRCNGECINEEDMAKLNDYPIYQRYSRCCQAS